MSRRSLLTSARSRLKRLPVVRSARVRLLAWQLALVLAALVASTLVTRQFLLARMDDRIDRELRQEVDELRTLADTGIDPVTGRAFADTRRLMRFNLQRNIPDRNETMFALVDGAPDARVSVEPPGRLDLDTDVVSTLAASTDAGLRTIRTSWGDVRYAAVPVTVDQEGPAGVFVVAIFRDLERREVDAVVLVLAVSGAIALALAAAAAWVVAGRVLSPVRAVRRTAESITHTDLSRRIDVRGTDEIAELASTFNRMLERLDGAFAIQRQFVDDAGHELRTPITVVRGHLELIGPVTDEQSQALAIAHDELDRMARMVDDLLDLAKSDQPDFLRLGEVEVGDLTDEIFTKAEALGDRRWSMPRRANGSVTADRERVTQAVLQLAQNAVQHTEKGDLIEISSDPHRGGVSWTVQDDGPGVSEADAQRIFHRFARGGDGARRGPGVGLGLAIVAEIARAHGGRVELVPSSTGACFRLTVPTAPRTPAEEST